MTCDSNLKCSYRNILSRCSSKDVPARDFLLFATLLAYLIKSSTDWKPSLIFGITLCRSTSENISNSTSRLFKSSSSIERPHLPCGKRSSIKLKIARPEGKSFNQETGSCFRRGKYCFFSCFPDKYICPGSTSLPSQYSIKSSSSAVLLTQPSNSVSPLLYFPARIHILPVFSTF